MKRTRKEVKSAISFLTCRGDKAVFMAHSLRIEFPVGYYHFMNRSYSRRNISLTKKVANGFSTRVATIRGYGRWRFTLRKYEEEPNKLTADLTLFSAITRSS